MSRVLLHLGFHKTATTSAQRFLFNNRELIWPHAALILPERLWPARRLARWYSDSGDAEVLDLLAAELGGLVGGLSLGPRRKAVLSCETLIGPMPLGDNSAPYPLAADMIRALVRGVSAHVPLQDITVLLTLRDQQDWAESLWRHQVAKLRNVRITQEAEEFCAAVSQIPLPQQIAQIRAALPDITLKAEPIEPWADAHLGIGQLFFDFLGRPTHEIAKWTPAPRVNQGTDPNLTAELLRLNRSSLDAHALEAAKLTLLQADGRHLNKSLPDDH